MIAFECITKLVFLIRSKCLLYNILFIYCWLKFVNILLISFCYYTQKGHFSLIFFWYLHNILVRVLYLPLNRLNCILSSIAWKHLRFVWIELLKSVYEVPLNIFFITPTVKIESFLCNHVKKICFWLLLFHLLYLILEISV